MTEHNGLPVHGYKPQSDDKVALVNTFKQDEERLLRKIDELTVRRTFRANSEGESSVTDSEPHIHVDQRWLAIAKTDMEKAFMALNRAVFQPGRVKLPEDE